MRPGFEKKTTQIRKSKIALEAPPIFASVLPKVGIVWCIQLREVGLMAITPPPKKKKSRAGRIGRSSALH